MTRDTERGRPGQGAPDVVLATKLADEGDGSRDPGYRVTWLRSGWADARERRFHTEVAARSFVDDLRSDPTRPAVLNLVIEEWNDLLWGWGWVRGPSKLCGDTFYDSRSGAICSHSCRRCEWFRRLRAGTAVVDELAIRRERRRGSNEGPWGPQSGGAS